MSVIRSKLGIMVIVAITVFSIPDIDALKFDGWRPWNIYYSENRRADGEWTCFGAMPVPKRSLSYRSLLVDLRLNLGHCEPWIEGWMNNGFQMFIGLEKWSGYDLYFPLFWVMVSDEHNAIRLLGGSTMKIGDNWINWLS